jgi:hypothetical protein
MRCLCALQLPRPVAIASMPASGVKRRRRPVENPMEEDDLPSCLFS